MKKSVLKVVLITIIMVAALTGTVRAAPDDTEPQVAKVDVCRAVDWQDITAVGIIDSEHGGGACHPAALGHKYCHVQTYYICDWKEKCVLGVCFSVPVFCKGAVRHVLIP